MSATSASIRDYRRATSGLADTVDLMLTYVESGTEFSNQYGDMSESFYNSLESVLKVTPVTLRHVLRKCDILPRQGGAP